MTAFRQVFEGHAYLHRKSNQGDWVAVHLYEDLVSIGRAAKLISGIKSGERVVNIANRRRGIDARRGDGTFGEIIPGEKAIFDDGFLVGRGQIATVEIGAEVKILAKAMIRQIDRVINDLRNQVAQFQLGSGNPICVGIVGINHAERYVSFEGNRNYPTTGKGGAPHPLQEAVEAERRLRAQAAPQFDEFLVLRFRATNEEPFPFEWVNYEESKLDYGAALARISREYDLRFG
ncbi:MAG: hypothetical protein WAK91_19365 [Candidatus Acidiferrales bacterium]|jgi:tetrahydromethanopterin S-methyltransferase subunit F